MGRRDQSREEVKELNWLPRGHTSSSHRGEALGSPTKLGRFREKGLRLFPEEWGGGGGAPTWRGGDRQLETGDQHDPKTKIKQCLGGQGTTCVKAEISYTVTCWKGTWERKLRPEGP